MSTTIAAGIAAREQMLRALRRHETDLAEQRAEGLGAYELAGIVARLRAAITDEHTLTLREAEA